MAKKLIVLLSAMCLMLSACGSNNANYDLLREKYEELKNEYIDLKDEHEALISEYEALWDEYDALMGGEGSSDAGTQDQWEDDSTSADADTPTAEDMQEAPATSANLQTYSYITADNEYPGEGNLDFTITYDNDILTVGAEIDCVAVYLWENGGRNWETPHAYMNVRTGSWEEHYANPYSKWDFNRFNTDVYESYPLTINEYDGHGWAIYIEDLYIDWCNDIYIYTIQLDPDHYLYVESSTINLDGDCSFEELLTALLHDVTIP